MRIFIHPGEVSSRGGDTHFISFNKLCKLYGVAPSNAIEWKKNSAKGHIQKDMDQHLFPKHDGKYEKFVPVDDYIFEF